MYEGSRTRGYNVKLEVDGGSFSLPEAVSHCLKLYATRCKWKYVHTCPHATRHGYWFLFQLVHTCVSHTYRRATAQERKTCPKPRVLPVRSPGRETLASELGESQILLIRLNKPPFTTDNLQTCPVNLATSWVRGKEQPASKHLPCSPPPGQWGKRAQTCARGVVFRQKKPAGY
jgi:hypothetical protein